MWPPDTIVCIGPNTFIPSLIAADVSDTYVCGPDPLVYRLPPENHYASLPAGLPAALVREFRARKEMMHFKWITVILQSLDDLIAHRRARGGLLFHSNRSFLIQVILVLREPVPLPQFVTLNTSLLCIGHESDPVKRQILFETQEDVYPTAEEFGAALDRCAPGVECLLINLMGPRVPLRFCLQRSDFFEPLPPSAEFPLPADYTGVCRVIGPINTGKTQTARHFCRTRPDPATGLVLHNQGDTDRSYHDLLPAERIINGFILDKKTVHELLRICRQLRPSYIILDDASYFPAYYKAVEKVAVYCRGAGIPLLVTSFIEWSYPWPVDTIISCRNPIASNQDRLARYGLRDWNYTDVRLRLMDAAMRGPNVAVVFRNKEPRSAEHYYIPQPAAKF